MGLHLMQHSCLDHVPPRDGSDDGKPTLAELNRRSGEVLQRFTGYDVSALRSRCQYSKLLHLPRATRARTVGRTVPKDCEVGAHGARTAKELRKLSFPHAKAEALLAKQNARQRRINVAHKKGLRRKTFRCGKGKGGCQLDMDCRYDSVYDPDLGLEDLGFDGYRRGGYRQQNPQPKVPIANFARSWTQHPVLPHRQRFERWYRAVELAEETARHFRPLRDNSGFQALLDEALQRLSSEDAFDALRIRFLHRHGGNVLRSLKQGGGVKIQRLLPAPLSGHARSRFLQTYCGGKGGALRPTLHGTNVNNHASIFERGLLIPDPATNGLTVVHGSAHGLGVYSASVSNPCLALGFVQGHGQAAVLVCGVVDDTSCLAMPQQYCGRMCRRESSNIRVVDDAVIALTSDRIAPLFKVDYVQRTRQSAAPVAKKAGSHPRPQPKRKTCNIYTCNIFQSAGELEFFKCPWQLLLRKPFSRISPGALRRAKMEWASLKHHSSKWLKAHGYWNAAAAKAF
ncbi:unnamed protein product [Symbiodinium natans]|uniref:PARP catalytic domain-containing protein n=1 Tax=Symbiodinium natans TaxID=878477 RepID=A0A812PJ58_9DINO|nr:unnamed protein product [Symbiodinium natans]